MIELQGVHRIYRVGGEELHALNGLDMTIGAGEYLSIMGPSGSGKSTLLNVLGLLDRPSLGRYLLEGVDTTQMSDDVLAETRARRIGFVFQSFHLVARLTAHENVELPMMLAGIAPKDRRGRVEALLAGLGLDERAGHRPDQLSGGERQRVAIARAMVMQPTLLLADEPTGNLDRASGNDVVEALEQLNVQGITLLVVTHDPQIGGRARRRIRMVDGSIVEDQRGANDGSSS